MSSIFLSHNKTVLHGSFFPPFLVPRNSVIFFYAERNKTKNFSRRRATPNKEDRRGKIRPRKTHGPSRDLGPASGPLRNTPPPDRSPRVLNVCARLEPRQRRAWLALRGDGPQLSMAATDTVEGGGSSREGGARRGRSQARAGEWDLPG